MNVVKRLVDPNERDVARLRRRVTQVNALEPKIQALSDEELQAQTGLLRARLAAGEILEDLLPEAFAVIREAARRVLGERHYDVQLIGGMMLHEGKIAEMKTGEGKTLTATLPLYLNALPGRGAHLVTTNDFLVRWQAQWMGQVFEALGMTVGYIQHNMSDAERRAMYARDITYVENSELGFDYLRDNMAVNPSQIRLRDLHYAIVDEADSILIDEARTPLIISGETEQDTQNYRRADEIVRKLLRAHSDEEPLYTWDKKDHQAAITEAGQEYVERELRLEGSLVDPENIEIAQLIDNGLKAHKLYERDDEYVVMDGEVVIVDENTGHLQPGRRYSDGLHQAIEAKEKVYTPRVRQTVASITYQNFFRLYGKLAGMTGTARSEEQEFTKIYGCRVTVVPTNRPVQRKDHPDVVFKTAEAKDRGIINELISCHLREQPVLVGTRSVEVSEHLAGRLAQDWVQAHVLVQILLDRVHSAGKELERESKDRALELLRQPLSKLLEQARHLRRRAGGAPVSRGRKGRRGATEEMPEITLGDLVGQFGVPENLTDEANLDAYLRVLGLLTDSTTPETLQFYRERLARLVAEGLKPGDENHESMLNVLNAKRHDAEGMIIARAGEPGMITIATNMAGRGVDIILGGRNPAKGQNYFPEKYEYVKSRGGLHVIGTERHESRRIDNQLRGRSGRQGDPGSSRFYVSLEDELMQMFGPERFGPLLNSWPEEEPIEARLVSRAIERAQEKVETRNFGYRKHTHEYDNVMNRQRTVIYEQRRRVLAGENCQPVILRMVDETAVRYLDQHCPPARPREDWQLEELYTDLLRVFSTPPEDEQKKRTRRRRGGSGIAVALAERDLLAMAEAGEDLRGHLSTAALAHGALRRNVDAATARELLEDEVQRAVDEVLGVYCPAGQPPATWRLQDVVRALDERYEGTAEDLGREGLLAIPGADLHEEVRRLGREVYVGRERGRLDLEIEKAVRSWAPAERAPEQADWVSLLEYLDYHLHDLVSRLAVDALPELDGETLPETLAAASVDYHEETLRRLAENRKKAEGVPELTVEGCRERLAELLPVSLSEVKPLTWVACVEILNQRMPVAVRALARERLRQLAGPELGAKLREVLREEPGEGENPIGLREFRHLERYWLLSSVDKAWMQHLLNMDELRDGIHLRGHAQRDPLIEYQREASDLFEQLMLIVSQRTTQKAFSATESVEMDAFTMRNLQETHTEMQMPGSGGGGGGTMRSEKKARRNDPCPCGSGKKYKMCCGG
jgi:preprotein translocase subunit SecA